MNAPCIRGGEIFFIHKQFCNISSLWLFVHDILVNATDLIIASIYVFLTEIYSVYCKELIFLAIYKDLLKSVLSTLGWVVNVNVKEFCFDFFMPSYRWDACSVDGCLINFRNEDARVYFVYFEHLSKEYCRSSHQTCNFIKKETLALVLSCEYFDISKNTFFAKHLWATASDISNLHVPIKVRP